MKRILVVLLTLILCVSTLASCDFLKNFAEIRDGETTTTEEGTTVPPVDNPPVEEYNVQAAADYVYNLYKNKTVTATDFEVTSKVSILGTIHTVEWSVDTDKVTIEVKDENTYIVNVDEESPEELAYVLTATIKGGDQTATKSFNLTVPEYMLTPFEEYIDMTEGNVVVKGIVVGINSKAAGNTRNHLFLADLDGKGGYYSYQMDADPVADLGIEVGMIVEVSGPVSPYSGMQEIKGGVARIVDSTIHEFDIVDITEAFANGSSLKNYVGTLVTIKGVEITGQELGGTSDYLKFKLNNKEAYVRTYVTDFPTTLVKDDKATIDAAHLEHFGWTANATGILVLYNSNPYLIPVGVDCFEYLNKVEKSNEEMIADVMNQLKLGTSYTSNAVVELPVAVYPEVVLTWASNNEALVAIADGKLTITVPDAATDVIVTVTATCGDKTATKEFTLKLSKTAESIKDIIDLGASKEHNQYTEEKHLVAGIISEVYNTTYGNMKIVDEFGNVLTIYGTYSADGSARYDAMENAPVAGDYVVIFGIVGQYSGTPQVKNGWIMSITKPTSVKDAIDTGASMEHNTYTEGKVVVTGVITEVYNTTYGNMKITDEAGNILTIYGTYSSTGANRYDAIEGAPVAGDTVTIYGILGQYNGTPQIKNGWIVAVTKGSDTPECTEHVDADGDEKCDVCGADMPNDNPPAIDTPAPDSTLSVKDAIDFALTQEHNVFTEGKYYVTGVIKEVYNDMYGNMRIVDEAGNVLTLYGTYNADGTVRYDALEVKPVAGDTITVYGIIGQYNGTPQVKNGWIVKHTAAETPDLPECTEHVDADGDEKCDVCGADVPAAQPPVEGGNTVTGVIADIAKANGWANSKAYASINLNADIIVSATGTAVGNYGLNTGKYYTNGENWRIYQAEKPELTITALNGKTIVSVKITYASQNTGTLTLNGEAVASGTVVTVNATSITFSVGNTGAATNGQARITAIEVVYAGGNDTPACEHAEEIIPASPATCTETGLSEGKKCSKCGEILVEQTIIAALGHTFVEGKCTACGAEDPDYVKPDEPKAEWTLVTELKDGDLVLIGAPAYGKLLSTIKVATYYNKGVDYSEDDFANVTDAEIFVVTVNEDGSYTFTSLTGDVIALADSYSSLNETGANKSWTLKSNGDGTFLVCNTVRQLYLEWYASKNNWSTYGSANSDLFYISFYVKTSDSGETPDPECKHTNTVVEGATEATCNTAGFTGNTVCTDCKAVIANGEEIPATGKHTFEEGKCTVCGAEDPDYVKPDAPAAGGSADFNTIEGKGSSSYASATTAGGWEISNSAIQVGGPNVANPAFPVIGPDNTYKAVCLNGKVSAPGKIVSPTLTGGISKLTINYTKMFTDTALSVTVTITDANGNTYTHVIEATLDKNEKYVVYTDEWVLDTPITGDFTIEIVNNSPTQNTGNKDRFTILDISWN